MLYRKATPMTLKVAEDRDRPDPSAHRSRTTDGGSSPACSEGLSVATPLEHAHITHQLTRIA